MSKWILLTAILVWAAQGATPPVLTVTPSPASISFSYQAGSVIPAAQSISLKASVGTPAFSTAVTGANSLWLTVSPDTGKLPGALSLRANPTSLAVGVYTANVSVTVSGLSSPVTVPVTLTIAAPPSSLTLSETALSFASPPLPAAQTVHLSTSGGPISFTAAAGSPWLTVTPSVGVVLPGALEPLTISVDPSALNPQAAPYVGKITVAQTGSGAAAKAQTITVNLIVNSAPPTITSVWPATLPLNAGPQTITLRGTNFIPATTVKLQGGSTALSTTVLSPTALLAVVPAAALTATATLNVVVSNPPPGGDSAPAPIAVGNVASIAAVGSVASYGTASVSPGELVTIFGTNLGPPTPASMTVSNGLVDTTLAGVSVTVDGQPAPLLYVSQNQITIQVPYEVTRGPGKQVSIAFGSNPPATATVKVSPTAPGIFTADGSGTGQAAALNFNSTAGYSLNSASNPVKPGDTVVLYLTGEGDYNPTLTPRTGLIVPMNMNPLPQLSPLPDVSIGGASAAVAYAGPLPGSILGLLQINAVVPATATPGKAAPVVVNLSGVAAQTGVTLSVHQ